MIKLSKQPKPRILRDSEAAWVIELQSAIRSGNKSRIESAKRKYNHSDIKEALKKETNNKCAYCEGFVSDMSYGDIEHIVPKSLDPSWAFDWENLTFACEVCNVNKSNKDPRHESIIDPYKLDPRQFLQFVGPLVNALGTEKGAMTILHLRLDRPDLVESRNEVLRGLVKSLENIYRARSRSERVALIEDFEENELLESKEFTAMRRDFWKKYAPV